jgi:ABC-2 type transport system ATP-binding protein
MKVEMQSPVLQVKNLTKSFEDKVILDKIDIELNSGEVALLYGPNGSGKSVFLNSILGFLPIDSGSITILGRSINDHLHLRQHSCIVSIDHQQFMDLLTPAEYFSFLIDLYSLNQAPKLEEARQLSVRLNVGDKWDELISSLSFGSKKKIQLIGSLIIDPAFLVCDEIFEGLDSESVEHVLNLFHERKNRGKLSLITTHLKEYGDAIATKSFEIKDRKLLNTTAG